MKRIFAVRRLSQAAALFDTILLLLGGTAGAQIGNLTVTSAASFEPGLPPRGSLGTVFCTGLSGVQGIIAASGFPLPTELAGVRVRVGGALAPVLAVAQADGFQQINFQVPQEAQISPGNQDSVSTVSVEQNGQQAALTETVRKTPGDFFRLDGNRGIFQHGGDYSLVTPQNPAAPGEMIIAYLTGMPGTNPVVATGQPAPADPPAIVPQILHDALSYDNYYILLEEPNQYVLPADLRFLGLAPGLAGVYQINFQLPTTGLPTGPAVRILLERLYCSKLSINPCPGPSSPRYDSTPVTIPIGY